MNEIAHRKTQEFTPAHHEPQADGLLSIIQKVATDDRFDVDKMKALLEMRAAEEDRVRRIEREDRDEAAKRAWLANFSKVQAEIGPIARGRENKHTSSRYADLADIERIVTPILTKYGFSTTCVPIPCEANGCIRMRLTIGHAEGHEKVYEDDFPIDAAGSGGKVNKTAIQAKGSTQTYGRRYLKASALDLAFMDDDDGNAPPKETISEDQFHRLRNLIEKAGLNEDVVLKAEKVSALHFLPAARFAEVERKLNTTIKNRSEGQ